MRTRHDRPTAGRAARTPLGLDACRQLPLLDSYLDEGGSEWVSGAG
jgi:hypothetical protein